MTTIVRKSVVAMAVVIGIGLGTGAQVSAGTELPSHVLPGDGGRASAVGANLHELQVDETVGIYARHGIGFLAE